MSRTPSLTGPTFSPADEYSRFSDAVPPISDITLQTSAPPPMITIQPQVDMARSYSATNQAELRRFVGTMAEHLQKLQEKTTRDGECEDAQWLKKIVARGINLEWFTKAWDDQTSKEKSDTLGAGYLIALMGLGGICTSLFAYHVVGKRLANTPRNDPGRWGDLRRWVDRMKGVPVPSRDNEQGVELASLPIRPEPAHTAPPHPSAAFEADPES